MSSRSTSPRLPRLRLLVALLVLVPPVAFPALADGAETATGREFRPAKSHAPNPELEALLDRLKKAQTETESMTATFRQVKEDALFAKPTEQAGRFFYSKGGNFRWDYSKPEKVTLIATRDTVQRWVPSEKRVQKSDIAKNRQRLFNYFGIGSDVNVLTRHFNITFPKAGSDRPGTDKIELKGKQRRVQKRIKLLEMWIDKATSMPTAVRVSMANGSTMTWEFTDVKLNGDIPAGTYVLKLPAGTKVERTDGKTAEVVDEIVDETEDVATPPPSGK